MHMSFFFSSKRWAVPLMGCILITSVIAVTVRWKAVLTSLGSFLVDSQPPQSADLIVVLGGDFWGPRVLTGSELARAGYAPTVLLSGPPYNGRPQGELSIEFLVQKGYPSQIFQVFANQAHSTITEAIALRGELARRKVKRVLLVTTAHHSRRAAIVLTLFCPGIRFISIPAPDSRYHADQWWSDKNSRHLFVSEWRKILGSVLVLYPVQVVSRLFGRGMAMVRVVPVIFWLLRA
jgi:uncharacterized SAM-binding protein YcdF (DUF218 family)